MSLLPLFTNSVHIHLGLGLHKNNVSCAAYIVSVESCVNEYFVYLRVVLGKSSGYLSSFEIKAGTDPSSLTKNNNKN